MHARTGEQWSACEAIVQDGGGQVNEGGSVVLGRAFAGC